MSSTPKFRLITDRNLPLWLWILAGTNLIMIIYTILLINAYIHPTSLPFGYPLRFMGKPRYDGLVAGALLLSTVVGILNIIIIRTYFRMAPYHLTQWRQIFCLDQLPVLSTVIGYFGLLLLGVYGALSILILRPVLAKAMYKSQCYDYVYQAEFFVLKDFPDWNGSNTAPVYDASTTVGFGKVGEDEEEFYYMDLIRPHNQSLEGFWWGSERNSTLEFVLRMGPERKWGYFNETEVVEGQRLGKTVKAPGPVAKVTYDLLGRR